MKHWEGGDGQRHWKSSFIRREARTGSQGKASCLGVGGRKGVGCQLTSLIFFSCGQSRLFYSPAPLWPQQGTRASKEQGILQGLGSRLPQQMCFLLQPGLSLGELHGSPDPQGLPDLGVPPSCSPFMWL